MLLSDFWSRTTFAAYSTNDKLGVRYGEVVHPRPAVAIRVRSAPSHGNLPLAKHAAYHHIVYSSIPSLRNQTAADRGSVHRGRRVRARCQSLNIEGPPHILKHHSHLPLGKAHHWWDARTKLRRRLASAYDPPEIRAMYRGLTVGPVPPSKGVTRWLSPVTDPLFTKSRSEPQSTPTRRRHQAVKSGDQPALHEVVTRSNALFPGGFGVSTPQAPALTGLVPF